MAKPRPALFDAFDAAAEAQRDQHLPADREGGKTYYEALLGRYHAAVLADDVAAVDALEEEARRLAVKMNDGEPGILADADAPASWLGRVTAAPTGTVPIWGQAGDFLLEIRLGLWLVHIRITTTGLFGHGFSAHAVHWHRPFISQTGYHSFMSSPSWAPLPFEAFVRARITGQFTKDRGRLIAIGAEYIERGEK